MTYLDPEVRSKSCFHAEGPVADVPTQSATSLTGWLRNARRRRTGGPFGYSAQTSFAPPSKQLYLFLQVGTVGPGRCHAARPPFLLLQLDKNQVHSVVPGIFGQMHLSRSILRVSGLRRHVLLFAIRQSELCLHVCQHHRNGVRVAVHDRFFVRSVMHFQNPHLVVFADHRVMLRIYLHRILRPHHTHDRSEQHPTTNRHWHSHIALLLFVFLFACEKASHPTPPRFPSQ